MRPHRPFREILLTLASSMGLISILIGGGLVFAGDWLQWRGPLGTGISDERVPLTWSTDKNVKWKVALPDEGNSTPIVAGGKVFVTCPQDKGKQRLLLCLDRTDGKELWRKTVPYEHPEATHGTNPHTSSSPVSDGSRIYVWFGSAGIFCYDVNDGHEHWKTDLKTFDHIWGYGSSPVIVGDLVILNAGPGTTARVVALDKQTGAEVWHREYPGMKSAKAEEFKGSWSTPVLLGEGASALVLLSLPKKLLAVKPANGDVVWSCDGLSDLVYTSPVITNDIVVAMCGYHGPALACRLGGQGDVTASHRLWLHDKKNPQRIGSGVAVGGHVYILNENGVAWCLDAQSGEKKWEQRIGDGTSWGSMCVADGRIYVQNMQGNVIVLAVDPTECRVLSQNMLNEGSRSSPAFSNGEIFLRTFKNLYCIAEAKP